MKKILLAVFTLALALGSLPVYAATQTTTMPVSVTIAAAVTVSATGLNFGTVAPYTYAYGNASITVNAANETPYIVTIDAGLNYNGDRRLLGTSSAIQYNLFTDAARTTYWGDPGFANSYIVANATGVAGIGSGSNQTLTVYGYLTTQGYIPGTYTDTVTVTVNY